MTNALQLDGPFRGTAHTYDHCAARRCYPIPLRSLFFFRLRRLSLPVEREKKKFSAVSGPSRFRGFWLVHCVRFVNY